MKRLLTVSCILLIAVFALCSCGEPDMTERKRGDTVTLNVYNWGEYISDGSDDAPYNTNKEFENYFNEHLSEKYGGIKVKVNYTTYPTNEDMYSKLESGSGTYDVIVPSEYMIEKLINEDMLYAFDVRSLSNFHYVNVGESTIADYYKNYDAEYKYTVPYTYGRTGIIYNTTMVDEADIGSWGLLWDEKYSGKILQFNNPRDAFGSAMYWKGIDVNTTSEAEWEEALALLKDQKPLLQGYVNDEIFDKMTGESAAIAPYFVGDYVTMSWENEDLAFFYPEEGGNVFVDAMCIPKNSKNPDIATEYINFMLDPETAVANASYIGYASPHTAVYNDAEYVEYMGEDIMALLYGDANGDGIYGDFDGGSYTYYRSFTPETQRLVNKLWEELKIYGTIEVWVHVTSGILVGAILILAVYTVVIKKRRSAHYRKGYRAEKSKAHNPKQR